MLILQKKIPAKFLGKKKATDKKVWSQSPKKNPRKKFRGKKHSKKNSKKREFFQNKKGGKNLRPPPQKCTKTQPSLIFAFREFQVPEGPHQPAPSHTPLGSNQHSFDQETWVGGALKESHVGKSRLHGGSSHQANQAINYLRGAVFSLEAASEPWC